MPTIIDSLLVTLGLDPSGMKKGAAEGGRIQKKLEDDSKKSNKRMSDDDKKRAEEQKRQNKQATEHSRAVADAIRKVRNETIGLLGLFMGGMGVKNFVANTVDQAASLKFLSDNLDTSVESIQAYQRASERMGGTAAGATAQLLESQRELSRLRTGQGPSEAMQATFRAAGMAGEALTQKDLSTGNDYLMARSRIIATLYKQNAANAALMAQQMGISEDQFNLIKQGPAALQKLVDAQRRNSVISGEDANRALELKNRWLDFTDSMQASGTKILVSLIPAFKQVLSWLQGIADYIVAHRQDIANWINATIPKVIAMAEAFGRFVKDMDWKGLIADAKVLLSVVTGIADAVKGIGTFFGETAAKAVVKTEEVSEDTAAIVKAVLTFFGAKEPEEKPTTPPKEAGRVTVGPVAGAGVPMAKSAAREPPPATPPRRTAVGVGAATSERKKTGSLAVAESNAERRNAAGSSVTERAMENKPSPYFGAVAGVPPRAMARIDAGGVPKVGAGTVAQNNTTTNSTTTDVKIGQLTVQTQANDPVGVAKAVGGMFARFPYYPQAVTGM